MFRTVLLIAVMVGSIVIAQAINLKEQQARWLEQYMEVPKPLPPVRYVSETFMQVISGNPTAYGAYWRETIYINKNNWNERRNIILHELVHHAGGGECMAYTLQVKWIREKGLKGWMKWERARRSWCNEGQSLSR